MLLLATMMIMILHKTEEEHDLGFWNKTRVWLPDLCWFEAVQDVQEKSQELKLAAAEASSLLKLFASSPESTFSFFTRPNALQCQRESRSPLPALKETHTTAVTHLWCKLPQLFYMWEKSWEELTQECWNQFISASITPLSQHQREASYKTKCVKFLRRNSRASDENWQIKTSKRKFFETLFDTQGN